MDELIPTKNILDHFRTNYKKLVMLIFNRNLSNYDSMLLITGDKGTGKSNAGIVLCRVWCWLLGIRWDPKRHIAFTNEQVNEKIDLLNPFEPLLCDEAVNFALASEWQNPKNKALIKKLAKVRTKHLFFVLCWPFKISKMQKSYLDSFVNFWIDLTARTKTRSHGTIFLPDKNPYYDTWRLDHFKKIGSYNEFTNHMVIQKKMKSHPNYWVNITFPKAPKRVYKSYLVVREAHVYDVDGGRHLTKGEMYKNLLLVLFQDMIRNDPTLKLKDVVKQIKDEYNIRLSTAILSTTFMKAREITEDAVKVMQDSKLKIV